MSLEDQHVLEQFAEAVRGVFSDASVIAFGSRARGEARWDSDLDLCVILGHPATAKSRRVLDQIAFDIGFEQDRILTLMVVEREQFERGALSASPLAASIRREGVAA